MSKAYFISNRCCMSTQSTEMFATSIKPKDSATCLHWSSRHLRKNLKFLLAGGKLEDVEGRSHTPGSQTPSQPPCCVCGGETSVQLPPIVGPWPPFVPLWMLIWGQWRHQVLESVSTKDPLKGERGRVVTGTGGAKMASVSRVLF